MKRLNLDHELTPPELSKINAELEVILQDDDLQTDLLLSLITRRDECIEVYLSNIELVQRKAFVENELPVNEKLLAVASGLHKASLNQLSGLIKGLKAVKKYK